MEFPGFLAYQTDTADENQGILAHLLMETFFFFWRRSSESIRERFPVDAGGEVWGELNGWGNKLYRVSADHFGESIGLTIYAAIPGNNGRSCSLMGSPEGKEFM